MPRACPVVAHVRCYRPAGEEGSFFLAPCSSEPNDPRGKPVGFNYSAVLRGLSLPLLTPRSFSPPPPTQKDTQKDTKK